MTATATAPPAAVLIARAGVALYGPAWQSALAEALAVNLRTVQRLAAAAAAGDDYRAARALIAPVLALVEARGTALATVRAALVKAGRPSTP